MEKKSYKPARFAVGEKFECCLSFDSPLRTPSKLYPGKTSIWYGIEPLIDGTNGFNATESLSFIIERMGLKKGDKLVIEKCQGDSFAFFTVNGKSKDDLEQEILSNQTSTSPDPVIVNESPGEMSDKEKLDILWQKHNEDIPF